MNRTRHYSSWLLGTALAALATSACGFATEYCDAMCECELCNDRKYDECIIEVDAALDRADAYDCTEDAEVYLQCILDEASCDDENWGVDGDNCAAESEDAYDCVDSASDLNQGTTTTCGCTCTCTTGTALTMCEGTGCCAGVCPGACSGQGYGTSVSVSESCG